MIFSLVYFQQFGEKIDDIKKSLLGLQQMYLNYQDDASNKWNEVQI